jgi:hypothetical protein
MATVVRREVKPEPPPVEWVITLTQAEASALRDLLGSGLGAPTLHGIGLADLLRALASAGIERSKTHFLQVAMT